MNDSKVSFLPSARPERPLFGVRPEDALRMALQETMRIIDHAQKSCTEPARGFATSDELAHVRSLFLKAETICQVANESFPFSNFPFSARRADFKKHGEYLHNLFVEAVNREAAIAAAMRTSAIDCQKDIT
jgi:hypothetical protein